VITGMHHHTQPDPLSIYTFVSHDWFCYFSYCIYTSFVFDFIEV
jgi:hypothetical protein